jgi:hypothetical protein
VRDAGTFQGSALKAFILMAEMIHLEVNDASTSANLPGADAIVRCTTTRSTPVQSSSMSLDSSTARAMSASTGADTGFEKIRLLASGWSGERSRDLCFDCESAELVDADGYRIQLLLVD